MTDARPWWHLSRFLGGGGPRVRDEPAGAPPAAPADEVPAWGQRAWREAIGPDAWLLEPWEDVSRNWPGKGLVEEANRRAAAGLPDWSFRQGAEGEADLAASIAHLMKPDRRGRRCWRMLHSIKVGTGVADLDHVLIGPPGVVVVNTKNHTARQRVDLTGDVTTVGGREVDHVEQVRNEAKRAQRLLTSTASTLLRMVSSEGGSPDGWDLRAPLSAVEMVAGGPPVKPLLCFSSNRLNVREWPNDVIVTTRARLGWTLENMKPVVDAGEETALFELARRSTTWSRDVSGWR